MTLNELLLGAAIGLSPALVYLVGMLIMRLQDLRRHP
jgi:hypothetical protein|tara:strand:- start:636 stop:746 length:111 start_codon:yes stop_codon:yes gene_type:complete